jgi:hypothetical protein
VQSILSPFFFFPVVSSYADAPYPSAPAAAGFDLGVSLYGDVVELPPAEPPISIDEFPG